MTQVCLLTGTGKESTSQGSLQPLEDEAAAVWVWLVLGLLRVLPWDSFKLVVPEFRGLVSSPAALLLFTMIHCGAIPLR